MACRHGMPVRVKECSLARRYNDIFYDDALVIIADIRRLHASRNDDTCLGETAAAIYEQKHPV